MSRSAPLRLFEAHGIEIEYMIVDAETLAVRPIADSLLRALGGDHDPSSEMPDTPDMEVELGEISASNELGQGRDAALSVAPPEVCNALRLRYN